MRAQGKLAGIAVGMSGAMACAVAMALAPSDAAAAACAKSILKCGCSINSPGTYILQGVNPMNSTGTCIDIAASNVLLNSGGPAIKGPGPATVTIGVYVEPSANKVFLDSIEIENFGTGVRVDGPNASTFLVTTIGNNRGTVVNGANAFLFAESSSADNVGIQVNATATDFVMVAGNAGGDTDAGIKLNGVNGAFFEDTAAENNGTFGIWLLSASNNHFDGFQAENNGLAGVYLGCNPTGPDGKACPSGVASSNGNSFVGSLYGSKNSIVSNTALQHFGIAVSLGNLHNHFSTITGTGNGSDDALDENPDCGSNRWTADSFTTTNPPSDIGFFCLN